MPAYRSGAEAEIREAVVSHIREHRPDARIIHEINVSSFGPNRVDLIAVSKSEIIAVEIKSAKDKLDRLPTQIKAMKRCSHHVVAAVHEKFLIESETHIKAMHYERSGKPFMRTLPSPWDHSIETWIFPQVRRCIDQSWQHDGLEKWRFPDLKINAPIPAEAIRLLWREELAQLCLN